jgi:glutathione S-transferase
MVTLYKFNAAWGMPDISPFCIKVETYLRMVGIPFSAVIADGRKAPKKKLPYVDDGGTIVADSRDIIDHFEAKISEPLDAGLTPKEAALATAFRGLLEEEVYFYAICMRWQSDAGWKTYVPVLREYGAHVGIPGFLAPLILRSIRKQVIRAAWGQGSGRHTLEQVEARFCKALDALSVQLGDGPYFLGERPRTIDATVHAFLWSMLDAPFDSPVRQHAEGLGNLREYCTRMRARYFSGASSGKPQGAALRAVGDAA